ncbi:uncharacterized protein PAC_03602 [Phialocephala subalpina]|uniref:Uncharacterized protein n=1 Tax=Phialocephala subalpina TaxID=576137 RepID=A0A1L7WLT0_9HELO|nr:uncharacterized protein PAC_03602 [Phialocephala subalpina]
MASLFEIPQELRDQIFEYVVSARIELPKNYDSLNTCSYTHTTHIRGSKEVKCSHQDEDVNNMGFSGALRANKQSHAETVEALRRMNDGRKYELDILITNERNFWPTWIYLPKRVDVLEELHVTFRIPRSQELWNNYRDGTWLEEAGGWAFHHFLERFLRSGAHNGGCIPTTYDRHFLEAYDGNTSRNADARGVRIKSLILDFQSGIPRDSKGETVELRRIEFARITDPEMEELPKTSGGRLAEIIEREFKLILDDWAEEAPYRGSGFLLFQRIGSLKFLIDGEPFEEIELGKELVYVDRTSTHKMNVYESRVKAGLSVSPLEEEEMSKSELKRWVKQKPKRISRLGFTEGTGEL